MSESPSKGDVRGAHLEAITRKALADGWARGRTVNQANKMAVQMVREKFPGVRESDISALIQSMRRG